ncbi:OLC1v1002087C1 [Oldenlandia corymbosa var. corymbosa]|uniref:OLC1v1002087C1 n=1 Tax=Oldenlandia corymbosa var. corymbosa TaxID=529605 RepID=A0AAV1D801_OLDCO|nr:OLC1v1002087C1 [Oldenlandia corymbosa var. corymbosa]
MDTSIMFTPKTIFSFMLTIEVLFFWSKFLLRSLSNVHHSLQKKFWFPHDLQPKLRKYSSFISKSDNNSRNETLVFHMEDALLRSSSLFPYFMLVAFEAGSLIRAVLLFLAYPFICLFPKEIRIKMMVFVSFFGIKKNKCRVGSSVLPKFFLEDVGYEGFEVLMRHGRKIGVSDLPNVMVEGFLKDFLGVDVVMGREMKVCYGYYVGCMEERRNGYIDSLNQINGEEKINSLVGFGCLGKTLSQEFFSHCKEIYLVSKSEKRKWHNLPRHKYPRKLIFHDGRLAFRPTFYATSLMFLWLPFGIFLCIVRACAALFLPCRIALPIFAFSGIQGKVSYSSANERAKKSGGTVYVCNHRTLLDPVYVSMALMEPVTAVTYSVSRVSEMISPIKTTRLKRDRESDLKMMKEMLKESNIVVCPEGTTCREPYLLRFSPLFAELTDDIVPVALDMQFSMFYGTTASGLKCFDPLFFLLNPHPTYTIKFLDPLPASKSFGAGGKSRYEVANFVQTEIGKALGFECTSLTRKDKYLMLAGNEGVV